SPGLWTHPLPARVFSATICLLTVRLLRYSSTDPATPDLSTLSLHDALPICHGRGARQRRSGHRHVQARGVEEGHHARRRLNHDRSEEHTSELQSPDHLVCRLLLEKKKQQTARSCGGRVTHAIHARGTIA